MWDPLVGRGEKPPTLSKLLENRWGWKGGGDREVPRKVGAVKAAKVTSPIKGEAARAVPGKLPQLHMVGEKMVTLHWDHPELL